MTGNFDLCLTHGSPLYPENSLSLWSFQPNYILCLGILAKIKMADFTAIYSESGIKCLCAC